MFFFTKKRLAVSTVLRLLLHFHLLLVLLVGEGGGLAGRGGTRCDEIKFADSKVGKNTACMATEPNSSCDVRAA